MRRMLVVATVVGLFGCGLQPVGTPPAPADKPAPLFTGLGNYHHKVTATPQAQRYFDQGLTLAFAFNHAEAERSFRWAAKLDPQCAMCWWGVAFVLGPNINAKMEPAAQAPAWEAVERASALAASVTPAEQAYIAAIRKRYAPAPVADRAPLDRAFADAMRQLVKAWPDDLEAASAFAESLMNLNPWDYYDGKGKPRRAETGEMVATLESVLKRRPDHAWAIHLYIHGTEASTRPERALPYADRLADLTPTAGHLVHMPAHTYMRVGRYVDAVTANERAVGADDSYLSQCHAQGVYAVGYVPHNHHFLWAAASMAGISAKALASAKSTDAHTAHEMMREPGLGGLQHFSLQPLYAMVRFGKWDEILAFPQPPADLVYPNAFWRYARGRALTARGEVHPARTELYELKRLTADPALESITTFDINPSTKLLAIAALVLEGEMAAKQREYKRAVRLLREGVKIEDSLNYNEPADWNYPVRHSLGAVLIDAGRPADAERVYREDLERNAENGWALLGLAQALDQQGKRSEAARARERLGKAWAQADISPAASRI